MKTKASSNKSALTHRMSKIQRAFREMWSKAMCICVKTSRHKVLGKIAAKRMEEPVRLFVDFRCIRSICPNGQPLTEKKPPLDFRVLVLEWIPCSFICLYLYVYAVWKTALSRPLVLKWIFDRRHATAADALGGELWCLLLLTILKGLMRGSGTMERSLGKCNLGY
jgi:hypothetical protein